MNTVSPVTSRALALAVAVMTVFGPLASAASADDRIVTRAEAFVEQDDARDVAVAFEVHDLDSAVVDPGNVAQAHARGCAGCQAIALSFQIILLQQPVSTLAPENLAVALNEECTGCDAAAGAYQFIVGQGQPIRLTPSGYQQLGQARGEVARLRGAGLSGPETVAAADKLADDIRLILVNEVAPVGDGPPAWIDDRRHRSIGDAPAEQSSTVVAAAA